MPIYEYECTSCRHGFELLRSMSSADGDLSCPQCHNGVRRKLSTFASFSKDASGQSSRVSGSGSGCGSCAGSSCSTCGS